MSVDISIGIPVHNQGSFLETAIRSALNQTVRPFEIIISNNHSTDETKYIIEIFPLISHFKVFLKHVF